MGSLTNLTNSSRLIHPLVSFKIKPSFSGESYDLKPLDASHLGDFKALIPDVLLLIIQHCPSAHINLRVTCRLLNYYTTPLWIKNEYALNELLLNQVINQVRQVIEGTKNHSINELVLQTRINNKRAELSANRENSTAIREIHEK